MSFSAQVVQDLARQRNRQPTQMHDEKNLKEVGTDRSERH